jgi:hypothetical protein
MRTSHVCLRVPYCPLVARPAVAQQQSSAPVHPAAPFSWRDPEAARRPRSRTRWLDIAEGSDRARRRCLRCRARTVRVRARLAIWGLRRCTTLGKRLRSGRGRLAPQAGKLRRPEIGGTTAREQADLRSATPPTARDLFVSIPRDGPSGWRAEMKKARYGADLVFQGFPRTFGRVSAGIAAAAVSEYRRKTRRQSTRQHEAARDGKPYFPTHTYYQARPIPPRTASSTPTRRQRSTFTPRAPTAAPSWLLAFLTPHWYSLMAWKPFVPRHGQPMFRPSSRGRARDTGRRRAAAGQTDQVL